MDLVRRYFGTKGFNWSEVHLYRSNFLQNKIKNYITIFHFKE